MTEREATENPTEADLGDFSSLSPETSVFINCPFDAEYEPLFDAIVFATVCSGFVPRSALESGTVAVPRIERICNSLLASKYSIHDLSRCRGEGDERLARFNMPLELGVAMASRFMVSGDQRHDWLVLVPSGHEYIRFVSDLAGYDPNQHAGTVDSIVPAVMSWLCTRPEAVVAITPAEVLGALPRFVAAKEQLDLQWGGQAPWVRVVTEARYAVPTRA